VAKRALGNGQCTSNLVTGYAKRMRTNGQIFGETESVAIACTYVDEITVIFTVESREASECVQTSCRLRVLNDIIYLKANISRNYFPAQCSRIPTKPLLFEASHTLSVW